MIDELDDVPYTKEIDLHVGGEGSLELFAQPPALFIVLRIHLVRERYLFAVTSGKKSDFLKHTREGTSCESATRETKYTDLISLTV